jgi:hypothetical protein
MVIRDGDWTLFEWEPKLGRQVWSRENPDGSITFRTDYEVEPTIDANTALRNMAASGWAGDYHRVASIPLNILYDSGMAQAHTEGDNAFVARWLNCSENRAWRTKDGVL